MNFHYLVRLTYTPRIIIYTNVSLILGSIIYYTGITPSLVVLVILSLLMPHLLYFGAGWMGNDRVAVIRSQWIDAAFVGVLCAAVSYSPMPCTTFVSALVISSISFAGLKESRSALLAFLFSMAGASHIVEPALVGSHGFLTDVLSMIAILVYGALVAHASHIHTRRLSSGKAAVLARSSRLQGINDNLRKYMSPQLSNWLYENQQPVCVRTCRKKLTVFFSDIEGFTELTDTMEAEALTALLNEYLEAMSMIALRHGGTIDKFMGDGVMIFFGDPVSNGPRQDAVACLRMALEMKQKVNKLRLGWAEEGMAAELHIRIGINSGYCTVGNFGCESQLEYTAIGSTVNLASRLEGSAESDEILISQETYALAEDMIRCRHKAAIRVKGIAREIDVYQVCAIGTEPYERKLQGFYLRMDPDQIDPGAAASELEQSLGWLARRVKSREMPDGPSLN